MKRNNNLVREIMLAVEEKANGEPITLDMPGYSAEVVHYHIGLLDEAGFLKAMGNKPLGGQATFRPCGLTWAGHEFLDAARNDTVWNQVREQVGAKKLLSVPFDVLKQLLTQAALAYFSR